MLCHQYATRPWRWLPSKIEDPRSPAFFDRVRKRGPQRRQFVDDAYLRTGRADESIEAIEELTRPSGTRATTRANVRAEMRRRLYCWVVDERRYCAIGRHWHEHCEECHGLLGSQYSKLCLRCNRLHCRVCRSCECNVLVDDS